MKKSLLILLALVLVISLVACAAPAEEPAETPDETPVETPDDVGTDEPEEEEVTLIFSTSATPGDAHADAVEVFKEVAEAKSNGSIKVDTFHSSSLFKQDQELAAVKSGEADLVQGSASWLADDSPWVSMFSAGYMFKSYDHMTKTLNGEIGEDVFERITEEQGVRPLDAWYLGTRQVNLVEDKEIKVPADLNGINLRMPNSEAWLFLGKAIGANPTPIAFSELYMALQTGTVDGQDNPLPTVQSAKFYEVTKSITITNHLVDSIWPVINEAKWQSLSDNQKSIVLEALEEARKYCDETNLEREKELIEFFKEEGLSVYEADIDTFSEEVLAKYLDNKELTDSWDMDLFERVQAVQ